MRRGAAPCRRQAPYAAPSQAASCPLPCRKHERHSGTGHRDEGSGSGRGSRARRFHGCGPGRAGNVATAPGGSRTKPPGVSSIPSSDRSSPLLSRRTNDCSSSRPSTTHDHAPCTVVVDGCALPRRPDQREQRQRIVVSGKDQVSRVLVGTTLAVARFQELRRQLKELAHLRRQRTHDFGWTPNSWRQRSRRRTENDSRCGCIFGRLHCPTSCDASNLDDRLIEPYA